MSIIAEYGTILLIMACVFGFFMGPGALAPMMSPTPWAPPVGSKALTVKQAICIAIVLGICRRLSGRRFGHGNHPKGDH